MKRNQIEPKCQTRLKTDLLKELKPIITQAFQDALKEFFRELLTIAYEEAISAKKRKTRRKK